MFAIATWRAAHAACSISRPSGPAIFDSRAWRLLPASIFTSPPQRKDGIEVAQHDVGVGHGGRLSAQPVAGRTRERPGAPRTGLKRATGVDPQESIRRQPRPPRGRWRERRGGNRRRSAGGEPVMMPPPTEYSRVRVYSPFSMSEALAVVPPMSKLMAFSTPERRTTARAPTTPAAGPRFDDVHRPARRSRRRSQAAVRLHDQHRSARRRGRRSAHAESAGSVPTMGST